MFSFFTKKHFLIDHLEGFIDIHNHILPGIDDGAKSVEDSIKLIKGFNDFGVTDFICTPHIMENYYPNNPTTINKAQLLLKNGLKMNGLDHVNIDVAAEHMIDSGFEKLMDDKKMMPLAKNYLLIEMSYLQASINFDKAIHKINEKGLFPILAHPERYIFIQGNLNKYRSYKSAGMLFQLNILSLTQYYGKDAKNSALKLLDNDMFDFLGSDVHNMRQLNAIKNISINNSQLNNLKLIIEKTKMNF
ncbi:Tyrosine-protein phosphatase YwqE [Maribacter sedimenticola]|uniref:protein-tyrosine-phosphatase n=1 Tax=Maribacter sedimenticola TaxID=228956 RepID=A0ABY1SJU0_9FLAO|nr:CpsB/CapC family capsule biosynthesis tyrosine phosphatase [Maribacter sedimenticola]SNR66209.1 Tyrosine-protein phosphatase YwqE [Maribacter sedimenticola]